MIRSIRKFLLFNLLIGVTLAISLTTLGNLFLDNKDIQYHLDIQLLQMTLMFQAVIDEDVQTRDLKELQHQINRVPEYAKFYSEKIHDRKFHAENRFEFQIWSEDGKLLLRSAHAPVTPLSTGSIGFTNQRLNDQDWRVFTSFDSKNNVTVIVAERYERRDELARHITDNDLFIMLVTIPILGVLVWLIVGRGLRPLGRVTHEVAHRDPYYLEPVGVREVPDEIKVLVDELNHLFLRLQEAFEREQRFASDAAHELRTPLAALSTQAQVIMKTQTDKDRQHASKRLIAGVDRCTHIVQQLLTMSRLSPEATLNNVVELSLPQVASDIIADLVPSALEKEIEVELIAEDHTPHIRGNVTALGILVRNLVDNAIRYTNEGGRVRVLIHFDKDTLTLSVIDNGPGIPPELRSRVFERFYRALGNKAPGSGLGLAIVQQIAGLHDALVKLSAPKDQEKGLQIDVVFSRHKQFETA